MDAVDAQMDAGATAVSTPVVGSTLLVPPPLRTDGDIDPRDRQCMHAGEFNAWRISDWEWQPGLMGTLLYRNKQLGPHPFPRYISEHEGRPRSQHQALALMLAIAGRKSELKNDRNRNRGSSKTDFWGPVGEATVRENAPVNKDPGRTYNVLVASRGKRIHFFREDDAGKGIPAAAVKLGDAYLKLGLHPNHRMWYGVDGGESGATWTAVKDPKMMHFEFVTRAMEIAKKYRDGMDSGRTLRMNWKLFTKAMYRFDYSPSQVPHERKFWGPPLDDFLHDGNTGLQVGTDGLRDGTDGLQVGTDGLQVGTDGLRDGTDGLRDETDGLRDETGGLRDETGGLRDETGGVYDNADGVHDNADTETAHESAWDSYNRQSRLPDWEDSIAMRDLGKAWESENGGRYTALPDSHVLRRAYEEAHNAGCEKLCTDTDTFQQWVHAMGTGASNVEIRQLPTPSETIAKSGAQSDTAPGVHASTVDMGNASEDTERNTDNLDLRNVPDNTDIWSGLDELIFITSFSDMHDFDNVPMYYL